MFRHPLGLEWGTVAGQEGWLDPRSKVIKKLLPKNLNATEERKIWKEISQKQAAQRHSQRWFVKQPDFPSSKTPVKTVGGPENMRSLLKESRRIGSWEKDWSLLNPDQIKDLGGKGNRITNLQAEKLMKADELAVQKALGQPLSPKIQQLNNLNRDLTERQQNRIGVKNVNSLERDVITEDLQQRQNASKVVDKVSTAAAKFTPSEVRRMTSGLHYNQGVGRWTAPRNSIRLMKANQEGLLPNQGQIAKTVSNQGWNLPLSGMNPADLGKTFGNIGSFPIPTESLFKNQSFANLGTASNAFTPGAAATNPVSFGAGAGAGADAGAGAAGTSAMGVSLAIKAAKVMLGKLLDPHAGKQILPAQNRPNVSSGNEDLWSRFYTG